jgi:hypothetical protein
LSAVGGLGSRSNYGIVRSQSKNRQLFFWGERRTENGDKNNRHVSKFTAQAQSKRLPTHGVSSAR